ncbi:alkane 1-monooxygenase [Sphingomonas qilianensis]|uniref:alkane 1-monooxygenase n=1 Tax=Sphingomonas qilianensis TaxID=1736690 RepID=UPI0031F48D86
MLDALPLGPVGHSARGDAPTSNRLLVLYAAAQTAVVGWVLFLVFTRHYGVGELIGIALSLGTLTGGIGIPAAHELIHSRNQRLRGVGLYLLAFVLYMHFRIEHIHGHHHAVATPDDPATAHRGEGLWRFVARSVPQQFASAWRIEQRLRTGPKGEVKRTNRLIAYVAIQVSLLLAVGLALGVSALLVLIGQAAMAILFLEATNYIEHYGLERLRTTRGYEPVAPQHSWNTTSLLTNSLAFNLGLHADHHAHPQRGFLTLRHREEAPQLPAGYLAMLAVAAVPPLWRRIMHPRLDAFHRQAVNLSALDPLQEEHDVHHA